MTTTTKSNKSTFEYISNPFKSSFDGISRIFKVNQTPAIVILVLSLFVAFFNSIGSFPFPNSSSNNSSTNVSTDQIPAALIGFFIGLVIVGIIVSIFISVLYTGVVNYVAWKSSKSEEVSLGEALKISLGKFWRILGIQIIVSLKIFGGLLLFIVPGIRAALRYQMVYFAMFDEDLDSWKSMDRVKFLTKDHLMEVFGIITVSQLLFPVAVLVQMGGEGILYPQLKHLKDNNLAKPQTHWLNYLGFILIAGFLFFISLATLSIMLLIQAN